MNCFSLNDHHFTALCCQLLGITMRADIPINLDLTTSFWKSLVGADIDTVADMKEVDPLTYSYIKKIEMVGTFKL